MSPQEPRHLFIIGPASVGKSTVGYTLARRLNIPFIDLDLEFNARLESTTDHIDARGYESYARTNSALFETLLDEAKTSSVFVTPGGFLAHESVPDLIPKHLELLKNHGVTILLLPGDNPEVGADLVVARQLARSRWNDDSAEVERQRFLRRFHLYIKHGNIQILSSESPSKVVTKIIRELKKHKWNT